MIEKVKLQIIDVRYVDLGFENVGNVVDEHERLRVLEEFRKFVIAVALEKNSRVTCIILSRK